MQWIYRKGGADTPTRMSTWEDHRRIGPVTLCLNHQGADESFAVWFTEVAVQSVASDRCRITSYNVCYTKLLRIFSRKAQQFLSPRDFSFMNLHLL